MVKIALDFALCNFLAVTCKTIAIFFKMHMIIYTNNINNIQILASFSRIAKIQQSYIIIHTY